MAELFPLGSTSAFEYMGAIFVSLIYTLLPLLVYIASLAIAFRLKHGHPTLQAAVNFKRGHWVALFVSLGVVGAGVAVFLFGALLDFLGRHYFHSGEKLGPGFPFFILGLGIGAFGILLLWLSAAVCIARLVSALISYVHSVQSKRAA